MSEINFYLKPEDHKKNPQTMSVLDFKFQSEELESPCNFSVLFRRKNHNKQAVVQY